MFLSVKMHSEVKMEKTSLVMKTSLVKLRKLYEVPLNITLLVGQALQYLELGDKNVAIGRLAGQALVQSVS